MLLALLFLSWVLGSHPWLFPFLHVHLTRVHQTFCSHPGWELLLHCREPLVSRLTSRDSAFHRVRWLRPPSPALDVWFFSFTPILGFGSRVSPALVCFFSPDCDFSGRRRPRRVTFALLCARLLVWSVPPAPSCGSLHRRGSRAVTPALLCSTLLRRSRWTWQCGSLPQLGLQTPRKLSGILYLCVVQHHGVILDPRVSLTSLAQKVSLSLRSMCCEFRTQPLEPLLSLSHVTSLHVC